MADLKLKDFVDEDDFQKLIELDKTVERVRANYVSAAKELAKGLKINVEGIADLEKLNSIYTTQSKNASSASNELTEALKKQSEISQTVTKRIEERLNAEKLSTAEIKKLTKASVDNAASLEKSAKAEANLSKAQNAGNTVRKKTVLTEEERLKLIRAAIALSNQEIHSKAQAKEVNKQLQKAVDVLKDTDENYIRTLARLNSTIGINTDYVKRSSDRYTQQKMTIGAYREEVKAAWIELQNGNKSMQNMGIIAKRTGGIIKNELSLGLNKVGISTSAMAKGFIAAQLAMKGIQMIWSELKQGIHTAIEFEVANSKLAAILGTTSDNIKELKLSARELGSTTKYTASEASNLQLELAKLGFTAIEIQQATKYILRFAQATGADLPEAAALAGASLRMFNADTTETERYVSAMAVATTKSALSFSYLQTAMPIAGSVAKTFGFEIEDVLALLGKLADAGVDASSAATATRNIMLNLANGGGKLNKTLGGNVKNLDDFVKGLKQAKDKGMELAEMLDITDKRSVNAFANFVNGADDIETLRKSITGVADDFAKMADEMGNNTAGAIKGLSSAWDELMITIYGNTGIIRDAVDLIADAVRDMTTLLEGVQQTADKLVNKGKTYSATEEDYKKDSDAIERRTETLIKAGEKETEAMRKAKKEQLDLLNASLSQENKVLTKAKEDYENAYANSIDESASEYIRENAKSVLKTLAIEYSTYQSSVNILEARKKRLIADVESSNGIESGVKPLTDKEKREQEKVAQEKRKIEEQIQESELSLMDEGLEKELAKISLGYAKKIAAIKQGGKEGKAAQDAIAKEMKHALDEYTIKYNSDREKKDIENALTVVQKGTKEELDLKLRQLELQREAEIDAANKSGEDVFLINEKYLKKKHELYEKHASDQILLIADNAAAEQILRDRQYQEDMAAAEKQYADDIKSGKDRVEAKRDYEEQKYQITLDYARKTTEAAIDALELELNTENISAEDRAKIAEKLQDLKADLAKKEAEAEIKHIEDVTKADDDARKKRIKNVQKWLQIASQGIGTIGDLIKGIYDGQIDKIENEQDANDDAYDRNIERIENLAERGAITEEEAEARKRAAKAATEAKNEELAKKKAEIEHKQAVWDKATSVAQAGIATALAITQVLPNFILAAIVGAMGALQVATILATPIPSYAEGTGDKSHPGGKALVGDAGKHEVVMHSGKAWITPDTPTIVDIPKGAQVFPDVDAMDFPIWDYHTFSPTVLGGTNSSPKTVVINDYSRLEKKTDRTNYLLALSIKRQRRNAYMCENEVYKKTIL